MIVKPCKNIDCYNFSINKRLYCSKKCSVIYVNRYLRDYSKNSAPLNKSGDYYRNPKLCQFCSKTIEYKKKRDNFCNHSCSASFNNKIRIYKNKVKKQAKNPHSKPRKKGLTKKELEEKKKIYNITAKICEGCNNKITYRNRKLNFCCKECRLKVLTLKRDDKLNYKLDCRFKFNLKDFESEFDFNIIRDFGWYAPMNSKNPNMNGVSRDHLFSISDGYKYRIDPKIISHPANCRLVRNKENQSKNSKSIISIEDLLLKIISWENKYGGGVWDAKDTCNVLLGDRYPTSPL